jgi:hypothetical protein
VTELQGTGSLFADARLRQILSETYTPEGVEIWLRHAAKKGWTLEEARFYAGTLTGMTAT